MQSRILAALLAVGVLGGVVGCSSGNTDEQSSQSGQASVPASTSQQSAAQQTSDGQTSDPIASMAATMTCTDYNRFDSARKEQLITAVAKSKGVELDQAKVAQIRSVADMTCADPKNKDKRLVDLAEQMR